MSDKPPPAKRMRYSLTEIFEVLVGKEQQRFPVYLDLLTRRSEFFRVARSERWCRDPSKPTTLDDVDAEDFSTYLHCVTWGAEFLDSHLQPMLDKYEEDSDDEDVETAIDGAATDTTNIDEDDVGGLDDVPAEKLLINLHLLADMLIDLITANLVIDKLISVMAIRNEYLYTSRTNAGQESTTDDSLLRKLVLDYHITSDLDSDEPDLSKHLKGKHFPSDFISDLLFRVFALNKANPWKTIRSVYCWKDLQSHDYHESVEKAISDTKETAVSSKQQEKKSIFEKR